MIVHITDQEINHVECDGVVLHIFDEQRPPRGAAGEVDWLLNGFLSRFLSQKLISGREEGVILLPAQQRLAAEKILIFGLGDPGRFKIEQLAKIWQKAAQVIIDMDLRQLAIAVPALSDKYPYPPGDKLAQAMFGSFLEGIKKNKGKASDFHIILTDFNELKTKKNKNTFREKLASLPGVQSIGF